MTLYEFIQLAVEAMGGVFIPIEYALCNILIPENYKNIFQGKDELLLAFDYEVAQENPSSEFVTYGSYIFDAIFQIARTSPLFTQRYAYVERLELSNATEKIKKQMNITSGSFEIVTQKKVMGLWVLYNYAILYNTDERSEETQEIWVNLIDGSIDTQIAKNTIFYDTTETFRELPHLQPVSMLEAYQVSYNQAEKIAQSNALLLIDESKIKEELDRIKNYYNEMIKENKKRASRKGIDEEKLSEILQKEDTLIREKNKQLHEIEQKYGMKTIISLDNAIIYHIPLIEFQCKIAHNHLKHVSERLFYFDPICKRIIESKSTRFA